MYEAVVLLQAWRMLRLPKISASLRFHTYFYSKSSQTSAETVSYPSAHLLNWVINLLTTCIQIRIDDKIHELSQLMIKFYKLDIYK